LAGWVGGFEHFLRISEEFIGNELFLTVRWLLLVMVDFYCFVVSLDVIGAILVYLVYAGEGSVWFSSHPHFYKTII